MSTMNATWRAPCAPRRRSTARLRVWSGRLCLWEGGALYVGQTADNTPHAHHAVQLGLGLDGDLSVRADVSAPRRRTRAVLIGSDVVHQLEGGATTLALAYVDAEGAQGIRLRAAGFTGIRVVAAERLAAFVAPLGEVLGQRHTATDPVTRLVEGMIEALTPQETRVDQAPDPRIVRLVRALRGQLDAPPTATGVATQMGLSTSRFVHLFRESTGIPYRRYLLWLRLVEAVRAMGRRRSLTEVAHGAGFADSAHMSRTFRRMFGIAPSAIRTSRG